MPRKDAAARSAYQHDRYIANRERFLEARREYRETHPEEIKANNARMYAARRDENRAKAAAYRKAHPDELAAYHQAYREAHREKRNAYLRAYYARNRERALAQNTEWHAAHPGMRAHYSIRRRVRESGNGGSHTFIEWQEKCDLFGHVCVYCGEARKLERDHDVPIIRGGSDDITNILPACRSCNSRKHTMTAREFIAHRIAA